MPKLAKRPYQKGDPLPEVGSICKVAGANTYITCYQDRAYSDCRVIGYTPDGKFACFQTEGCWPFVERLENCWFGDAPPPSPSQERRDEVPETWPYHGPDFNRWDADVAGFLAIVQSQPGLWLRDSQLKYLDFRVDTRDGGFVLKDRDGERILPDRVLKAVREATRQYGSALKREE